MMMKLKALLSALRSDTPPTEVSFLEKFPEGRPSVKGFNAILRRLLKSHQITKVSIRTGFLMDLSEEQIIALFETLADMTTTTHLKELYIQSSSRFHVQTMPLAQALRCLKNQKTHTNASQQLETLILEDMQVTAAHKDFISAVAHVVEDHPSLTTLQMRNFFANDWANTGPNCILDPLLLTLATAPKLETLELSGCGSHALTGHQTVPLLSPAALSNLFTTMHNLTKLELSFLELETIHFQTIARHLRINKNKKNDDETSSSSLKYLTLDYHKLTPQGFDEMMTAMEQNTSITSLSLRSLSDIGDDGFEKAMHMLQHCNYSLEELAVTTTTPNQQAEIDLYLKMNSAGRRLLREPKTSLHQWMDVLAKNSDNVDVTRHFLQEIPGLMRMAAALQA